MKIVKNDETKQYIGIHQEVLMVKEILGESVPKMIMQVAINKDIAERKEIEERLEIIEENIKSENFNTVVDIEMANKEIMDLIFDGYKNCVLQNDLDLEIRCFNIYEDTVEYAKDHHRKMGNLTEKLDKEINNVRDRMVLSGFLHWLTLSDTTNSFDEQYAWMIISSLMYRDLPVCGVDKGNYIADFISWCSIPNPNKPLEETEKYLNQTVERLKEVEKRLLNNKVITEKEGELVDQLIEKGLKN